MQDFSFPRNFYFGAATSAHQVEGGNLNDWTEFERINAKRQMPIAKRRPWPDYILENYPSPLEEQNYISGKAGDHYNRFREDFAIAKELGHNAHRFSIEWSRIEPEEGKFNQKEIEHYHEVIKACRERGMEPFVTLWHFTLPLWVSSQGGWESQKTVFHFRRFCERMGREFKDEVVFWIIFNEPSPWAAQAYLYGLWPPRKRSILTLARVYFNLIRAHRLIYTKLKEINPSFSVGIAENLEWWEPRFLRPPIHYFRNFFFLDRISYNLDFVGINYYQRRHLFGKTVGEVTDFGWEIYPKGLYYLLQETGWRFRKPIFITENGIADARDAMREKFVRSHLEEVSRASQEGVDIRGYFYWSLLDNFEWDSGFWPRFGLVEVDYKTQERRIRRSALEYRKIVKQCHDG